MKRFFNTAGPVDCERHYCLPPLERLDLEEVLMLIDQQKYFVLHAPRQTGKTSSMLALMAYLNQRDRYRCLYFNVEMGQYARGDVARGMRTILGEMVARARSFLDDPFPQKVWQNILRESGEYTALNHTLTRWSEQSPEPLVLLIDDVDALGGDLLLSVLHQLRAGYDKRPAFFPQSVILWGVCDVAKAKSGFNIKAASLRLRDFARNEMEALYCQHTEATGQRFEPDALDLAWTLTQGQPGLVNALGHEACFVMAEDDDRVPTTEAKMAAAKDRLLLHCEIYLRHLVNNLKEDCVRRVLTPVLKGELLDPTVSRDDLQYVIDLGLLYRGGMGLQVANPIYRELIFHELSLSPEMVV